MAGDKGKVKSSKKRPQKAGKASNVEEWDSKEHQSAMKKFKSEPEVESSENRPRKNKDYVKNEDSNEFQSSSTKSKSQTEVKSSEQQPREDKKDVELRHDNEEQSELMKSKSQLCVGTSCNLNDRKKDLLHCLSELFPGLKGKPETTDNWSKLFQDDGCPFGLYMERVEDSFFIWASSRSKGVTVKLELLSAFDTDSDELDVRNPLLAFSLGFEDGDMWQELKQFLLEMFCHPDASTAEADYIYAFTRIDGKFQLCIYKIKSMPGSLEGDHIKLSRTSVSFSLKPIEIHSSNAVHNFLEVKPKIKQGIDLINLTPVSAYLDNSHVDTIPHRVQHLDVDCVMLPAPPDSREWDGYNTTVSEFFQRYNAFEQRVVIGTGNSPCGQHKTPEVKYCLLLLPFKMFGRSLVSLVGKTIESKAHSFEKITVDHIRFRGKTSLEILGAKLIPYTDHHARRNLNEIGEIIKDQLAALGMSEKKLPPDLRAILQILVDKITDPNYPLKNYTLVKNSIVWMNGPQRCFAMDDLYDDFLYVLKPKEQLIVGNNFPSWKRWHQKIRTNWLLDDCRTFGFPPNLNANSANEFHAKRRRKLLPSVENNDDVARRLYNVQQCFKNIRNPFHHLQESAEKMQISEPLSRVDKDHIVSSCFALEYVEAQKEVPRVLALRNKADPNSANYERFDSYFPEVKFGPGDQK